MPKQENGILLTRKSTGEAVDIDCKDEKQLMNAVIGTSNSINRALRGRKKSTQATFAMLAQKRHLDLVMNPEYKGADVRILVYIEATLGYGNRVTRKQKHISKDLGLNKGTVSRSFAKLVKNGVIYKDLDDYGDAVYYMDLAYVVKGKRELQGTKRIHENERVTSNGAKLGVINGGKA